MIESAPEELIAPPWADEPVAASFEKVDPTIVRLPVPALPIAPAEPVDELPESVEFCTMSVPAVLDGPALAARVIRQRRTGDRERAVVVDGAALSGRVAGERRIVDGRGRTRLVQDAAAERGRGITLQARAADRQRAEVVDGAAGIRTAACERQSAQRDGCPGITLKIWEALPPLIVRFLTPVPWMASGVVVFVNTSGPVSSERLRRREEVLAVEGDRVGRGVFGARFSGLSLKLTLAQATADRMLP